MKKSIERALSILEDVYGGRETALDYGTSFQLLVSTILAAQSTDKRVNIVTKQLYKDYPTAKDFAQMSVSQLEGYIRTVGLYKTKAKNVLRTSKMLAEKYDGDTPSTREELIQLPGVGRKTANVVLSIDKNVPAIAVDTHVFRVSNRIGLARAANVKKTEEQLMKAIPEGKWSAAHHWLIWHGRTVCKARKPDCPNCPILNHCAFKDKTI